MATLIQRRIRMLAAALVIWTLPVFAQPIQLTFENYTLENGLPNNMVHQAYQDSRGYMWFATNHGICRYDGYRFQSFRNDPKDSTSLSGLLARVIYEDKKGNLWIGTESGGLNRFNRDKETFEHGLAADYSAGIGTSVKTIAEDKNGCLWLGTNIGIKMYDPASGKVTSFPYIPNSPLSPSDTYVRELQFDANGRLWVGTNAGLDLFDPATRRFNRMYTNTPGLKDEIWDIYNDPEGLLWIGTYNNGLYTIDPQTLVTEKIQLDATREWSHTIRSIVKDTNGLYWIGSRAGLYVYNSLKGTSSWWGNIENEQKSLVNNSVLHIYKDRAQNMWLCTRGGISLMVPGRQVFRHYKAQRNSPAHLNNNEIYAVWADTTGNKVWIGTNEGGVNILDRKTQQFTYLTHVAGSDNSVAGNSIKSFLDDGKNNMWIATYKEGISIYNLSSRRFTHFRNNVNDARSLSSNNVWALFKDKEGNIWVGSDGGLDLYDAGSHGFIHQRIHNKVQQVSWISEDAAGNLWLGCQSLVLVFKPGTGVIGTVREQGSCFYEDSKGRRWLATRNNGIAVLGSDNKPQKYYDEQAGLPNNQVFQILEDSEGRLWCSTANGLAAFSPETGVFTRFDKSDGIQGNQFHYGAAYKLKTGELVFGGVNGISLFDPLKVTKNTYLPPVVFTDLKIFNKSVHINDAFSVLKEGIAVAQKITLPYKYNVLTLEFAALNFVRPEKNSYKFKLEGFEKEWNESGHKSSATYTNLDPGTYTFLVKAANNDNLWNDKPTQIQIEVLPPFWLTWWFKLLVLAVVIAGIYLITTFRINREKMRQQLEMERTKVRQLNEVNALKLRFFTNISHEIRTPLTLIIGPLERIMNTEMSQAVLRSQVEIMYRNANGLLKLINQLLDFRKLESGSLRLELKRGDLRVFINETVESFTSLAEEKDIQLKFSSANESLVVCFDPEKLEKIVNNLLSNALKFTGKQGVVSVYLTTGVDQSFDSHQEYVELVVKDTGIGIEPRNRERIFHRFFQVSDNTNEGGTGIGLALTKELVKLHKGEIFVHSEVGKGTIFTVRLPLVKELPESRPVNKPVTDVHDTHAEQENQGREELLDENILLVIEDNMDVRTFIRNSFESQFHIVEAADGAEGLRIARKLLPDIILSDVMMPGMDGNELCRKLKKDEYTSHIPIVLLTALSSKQHIVEGLSSGADDYITKPFDVSILQTKIENLLYLRNSLRKKFTGELAAADVPSSTPTPDEIFLQKATEVVEANMHDTELDIEKFSRLMAVSRMQMYRKLSALTGMTVKEFIRDLRLKRAAGLLEQRQLNVSEVAYAVGFSDLSHFRKCFREMFGMNATDYLKKTTRDPMPP